MSSVLLLSLPRLSSVSVVFDFSASFNDVAHFSPISFPVCAKRNGKSDLLMNVFVCGLLFTTQIELSECCV